ncbi:hypothetical protein AB6A40_004570 [Gnathostoma spinigerum]|uniref:Uncharacterized protein n=1 Tax=Gnathostoma spinigerum TaxID=75299 RepID=A0ABD6EKB2_9BILA
MAVAKFWGEERLNDAVYAVYLRKVRYVPPGGFDGLPIPEENKITSSYSHHPCATQIPSQSFIPNNVHR